MAYAQWIGTYETEEEVVRKIDTMRNEGVRSEDIAVLIEDENRVERLEQAGDIQIETIEKSWAEKIMNTVDTDENTNDTLNNEGLDDDIKQQYREEVEEGKIVIFATRRDIPENIGEERIEVASVEGIPIGEDIEEIEYEDNGISNKNETEEIPITERYREKQTEKLKNK